MGTLNIVLHGLFAIVEEPYRVVLAVPHVDDHDTYVIQVQGDDKPSSYGRGNYELIGTQGPADTSVSAALPVSFPEDQNAKIGSGVKHRTDVFTTAPPAYATFTLPRPKKIYSCRCFQRGVDLTFTGANANEIKSVKFAQINVLAYDISDPTLIRLTGLPGFRAHYKPNDNHYVNMAIVSRGPHQNPPAVSKSFDQMMKKLIPGKKIHLRGLKADPPTVDPCTNIPGVDRATFDAFEPPVHFIPDDCVGLVIDNASEHMLPARSGERRSAQRSR
jgi:hypothetical protein